MMILVSACLAGKKCRYDGEAKTNETIKAMAETGEAILICPEELGGLPTPRTPCEIIGGDGQDVLAGRSRVIDKDGNDRTLAFIAGAEATLRIAKETGAKQAMLKALSPSCGKDRIYDGTFSGCVKAGSGVTAALLLNNGIIVKEI